MESSTDKEWATEPLLESSSSSGPSASANGASTTRKNNTSVDIKQSDYLTPPSSASPRREHFPNQEDPVPRYYVHAPERESTEIPTSSAASTIPNRESTEIPTSSAASTVVASQATGRNRGSSLTSRFPGDNSHRPLEIIKRQIKAADRAPHLSKRHLPGSDGIDRLDVTGGMYHHDGPYDAALLARNTSFMSSPLEALSTSNEEALKATPREKIIDSIEKHRPLDGVAMVPPGLTDELGRRYDYQEGADLMVEDGYRRWPGVTYLPEDLKGKGEPSYSIEKALKDHKAHNRSVSDDSSAIEMTSRPRSSGNGLLSTNNAQNYSEWEGDIRRSNTTGRNITGRLSKRLGSLRRRKVEA